MGQRAGEDKVQVQEITELPRLPRGRRARLRLQTPPLSRPVAAAAAATRVGVSGKHRGSRFMSGSSFCQRSFGAPRLSRRAGRERGEGCVRRLAGGHIRIARWLINGGPKSPRESETVGISEPQSQRRGKKFRNEAKTKPQTARDPSSLD